MDKAAPTYNRQGPSISVWIVSGGQEKTDFVVDSVPFSYNHSINASALTHSAGTRKIAQGTVELGQLINSFISDKGFADKQDLVWIIDRHQLGEGTHQWLDDLMSRLEFQNLKKMHTYLIILHTTGSVNQDYIKVIVPSYRFDQTPVEWTVHIITVGNSLSGDPGSILSVTPFVQLNTALAVSSSVHA